ncbi:MAG TPA: PAS domain S-box protein [Methanoregula sp.]|nr:PAS domain S-box protein [Methanoregula sp.]
MDLLPPPDKQRPFSHYLLVSMILLVVFVAMGITVTDYLQAKQNYEQNAAFLQAQTEKNIIQSVEIIDAGFRLFDDSQNEKLMAGFSVFMIGYDQAGRDPARMDLEAIKEEIGGNVDLYIINESNVIEFTTYSPDLGLDFRTVPYFSRYLTGIRNSEGYFSDRVVSEITTGDLRKYAYMPTPDHRYIFELGLTGPLYDQQHSFESYQKNIDQIVYLNPFVKDVAIYDMTKRPVNRTAPLPDADTEADLDQVIATRTGMELVNSTGGTKTTYLFVDLMDNQYGSDVSRIVRITYDTTLIGKQLEDLLITHFLVALLAVLLGIIAAILLARFLARPVYQIVSDVNRIAQGDLDHTIAPPAIGHEFVVLEESVNTMVSTLNAAIEREKVSEERYRRLIENIPDVLWTTTQEGRTMFISPNVEIVYGYTPEEIHGQEALLFFDQIHKEDHARVTGAWKSLFTGNKFDIEYRIQRKDGIWIWLHDRSTAVYERDGTWYADGIFSDISARKQAEEQLHRFYSELEQRVDQRTAELQRKEDAFRQASKKLNLLSSITRHDILNQLTILTGYIKLAEDRIENPDARKYLATAQKAAGVIDRHMIFTRLYQNVGVHAPTWQNVQQIVDKTCRDLPSPALTCTVDTGDLELYADPLLEKVFFTLLENTLRHGERATRVRVTKILSNTGLTLICEDDGIGIAPHEKERIFEWGYGKHTGFGLFLSREILAITGLSIKECGEAGNGARFEITVPAEAYRFLPPPAGGQEMEDGQDRDSGDI